MITKRLDFFKLLDRLRPSETLILLIIVIVVVNEDGSLHEVVSSDNPRHLVGVVRRTLRPTVLERYEERSPCDPAMTRGHHASF